VSDELLVAQNDNGDTPLHLTAKEGKLEVAELLVARALGWPGDMTSPLALIMNNKAGNTALHEAVPNHRRAVAVANWHCWTPIASAATPSVFPGSKRSSISPGSASSSSCPPSPSRARLCTRPCSAPTTVSLATTHLEKKKKKLGVCFLALLLYSNSCIVDLNYTGRRGDPAGEEA